MGEHTALMTEPTRWDHRRTKRLFLDHVHEDDIDDWHRLHADPRVWTHFPSGRHTDRAETADFVRSSLDDWERAALGYWTIREQPDGPVVGCGGCRPVAGRHRWNLYYRFRPESQGQGYAAELAAFALGAANGVEPDWPVTAIMLEHNVASWRVAEKIGMIRIWSGPDEGNPDPAAVRLVYADRSGVTV